MGMMRDFQSPVRRDVARRTDGSGLCHVRDVLPQLLRNYGLANRPVAMSCAITVEIEPAIVAEAAAVLS